MNKSVLLEIAKEPDPARQNALWAQAQAGELTVRKVRASSGLASKGIGATATLQLPEVTVRLEFRYGKATSARINEALSAALKMQSIQS